MNSERWMWTPQKIKFIEDTASVCASLTKRLLDLEKLNKESLSDLLDCIEKLQNQVDEIKLVVAKHLADECIEKPKLNRKPDYYDEQLKEEE